MFLGSFEKATCGYVGMRNLGATCYMNSLMQQLYMVPPLRYGMLQSKLLEQAPTPDQKASDFFFGVLASVCFWCACIPLRGWMRVYPLYGSAVALWHVVLKVV